MLGCLHMSPGNSLPQLLCPSPVCRPPQNDRWRLWAAQRRDASPGPGAGHGGQVVRGRWAPASSARCLHPSQGDPRKAAAKPRGCSVRPHICQPRKSKNNHKQKEPVRCSVLFLVFVPDFSDLSVSVLALFGSSNCQYFFCFIAETAVSGWLFCEHITVCSALRQVSLLGGSLFCFRLFGRGGGL